MGLDTASSEFVCAAKSFGVDFTDTLMIGRQKLFPAAKSLQHIFSILGVEKDAERFLQENQFGEEFFRLMGAQEVNSLDYSSYEGATFVQDLNLPITVDQLRNRFSVVYDGGTLEHVFNVPQALKNCMEMIRVGGYFMQANIANNFMGHGFWQFSPELLFRVFSESNGYEVKALLLNEVVSNGSWYLVSDPDSVRGRVELCNSLPTYILTIAKRIAEVPIFETTPLQSDYVACWNEHTGEEARDAPPTVRSSLPKRIRRIPKRILQTLKPLSDMLASNKEWTSHLIGNQRRPFDRAYYTRIDKEDLLRGRFQQQPIR